ncbi:MAG: hypothetical protein LBL20_02790 [Treponema sp.]|jgi:hypothetical protein|nr:hypothetical protein [Treponema sp.]
MPEIMIFRAGNYPQGDWPKERVQKLVDAYDPEKNFEAPLVIGHRWYTNTDEGQYAHGWVESLRMDGAGKVFARIPEFSAQAKQAMAEKKLRYVSVELYEFDKTDAAKPPYLRAIALLGRDTPQIPATRLPSLFGLLSGGTVTTIDEQEHIAAFTRKVNTDDILSFKQDEPGADTPRPENHQEVSSMDEAEKLKADLAAKEAELAAFRKENEDLKNAGRKQDAEAFFSKLRDEGKLPPALFEKAAALDARLDPEGRQELRALFSGNAPVVNLSGTHQADKQNAPETAAGDVNLAARIKAFQAEKKLSGFAEAATLLHGEHPEWFDEAGGEA